MNEMLRGRRHALALAASLGFVAALSACEGAGTLGGNCLTNRDCPPDQQCISGSCKPLTSVGNCTTSDDCSADEFCNGASTCEKIQVYDCTTDEQCPAHQKCNTVQGICIDGYRSCTSQSQCQSAGLYCDFSIQQCRDCTLDEHCPTGSVCSGNACVPENELGCQTDPECQPPFTVCQAGDCVAGCASVGSPVTCGSGTACDSTTGRCGPGNTPCNQDSECGPPSGICENQRCNPGCSETGGLQCTGGYVCNNQTGRCVPPGGCAMDSECAPPASVCENSQCVGGCGQIGGLQCGTGSVCDTNTGRCVQLPSGCTLDTECAPPSTVCEGGQCVGGCGAQGGLQCIGNTVCNTGTGRCDPGASVCTTDAQCGAPANICDFVSGQCVLGCGSTGCTGTDICNTGTGRCGPPTPTAVPLDGQCTAHSECQSQQCFNLEGIGTRCVSSCRRSADCPTGFTCYNYNGANLCIAGQHFGGASFSQAVGTSCQNGGQCQSNFCPSQTSCTERCTNTTDCGGTQCSWRELSPDNYIAACTGPVGGSGQSASCSSDANCQSGVCVGGQCGGLCSSSSQCPTGTICALANYSVCPLEIVPGLCIGSYIPNIVRACLAGSHGSGGVGSPCATYTPCRSGLCHTGIGQCTDTCGIDADCPSGWRCRAELYGELPDQTPVFINVCLPE